MRTLGIDKQFDLSPAVQETLEQFADARERPVPGRLARVEAAGAATYLAAAGALAVLLPSHRPLHPVTAVVLVVAFVLAMRVRFEVGVGYGVPTQIVFVPMLLLLPVGLVPLLVLGGLILGNAPEWLRRRSHIQTLLVTPGDCWYAIGPALVVGLAGSGHLGWSESPVYLGALAAQFAFDLGSGTVLDWAGRGIRPSIQLGLTGWVLLVDLLLAPIGLAGAFATARAPLAFLLVLPLAGLLAVFAKERSTRIGHAVELSRTYRGTTLLLSDVLEADDAYTGSHSQGVVQLAVEVADGLGLDPVARRNVEFGALLHDIGKISIPNEIINKPGPLDHDEWLVIKTHTLEGQRMLDRVGGVMREIGRIVRSSHERWDGAGYPDGLMGEEIPLESRIVACCDAYSAMTTDRSYRGAMTFEDAVKELHTHAGTQFDPRIVDVLVAILERRRSVPQWSVPAEAPVAG